MEYSLGWRAFGLCTGRGISEGDVIYGSSAYMVGGIWDGAELLL